MKSSQIGPCLANMKNVVHPISNNHTSSPGYYKGSLEKPPGYSGPNVDFNDLAFGSNHPGGAHFVYADASAHFLVEDTNLVLLRHLATIGGGETQDDPEPSAGGGTGRN